MITVINRSEVVGRPLAALLANDGARVLSVDIDCASRCLRFSFSRADPFRSSRCALTLVLLCLVRSLASLGRSQLSLNSRNAHPP